MKSEMSNRASLGSTFREGPSGKRRRKSASPRMRRWTGSRVKTVRIANVENNALNFVSISSGGALDTTHCDFSARAAWDEMRHIIASSEADVIIGSDKDRNRGCRKKDKDHI